MNIKFGTYEYELVPDFEIIQNNEFLKFSILANEVPMTELEEVLKNKQNLLEIEIRDETNYKLLTGYNQLTSLVKTYGVEYGRIYENVVVEEAHIDPDTGENVPEVIEEVEVTLTSDIIEVEIQAMNLAQQVSINTANIEFLAIMNDIEL